MQPIEIFRAGTHTAMDGRSYAFSQAMLAEAAAAYDPALHEAPIVVGHPKGDAPAYGWVGSLAAAGGKLSATPHQVDPAFAELVKAGRYKKVSAAFYHPDAPGNPKPGGYYLRHVGFLGAEPPAVKGLKAVAFAEAEGVIEFSDGWALSAIARLFGSIRDWMISQAGQERADQVLPRDTIEAIQRDAVAEQMSDAAESGMPMPAYAETQKEPAVAEQKDKADVAFAEREAALAAREADLARREHEARTAEDAALLDRLVKEGRLLPANRAATAAFMAQLDASQVVEFAEGRRRTAREEFHALLAAGGKLVEFREVAPAGAADAPQAKPPHIVAEEAVAFQEAERVAGRRVPSIAEAVALVEAQQS